MADWESSSGTVLEIGDGIVKVGGLAQALAGELLSFEGTTTKALALNLEEDSIGGVLLGSAEGIQYGQEVFSTGTVAQLSVDEQVLGQVLDPLGKELLPRTQAQEAAENSSGETASTSTRTTDGRPASSFQNIESPAPGIILRESVSKPLQTGVLAIDSMIPIGCGQRELIIGDRQTGKTAIAIDSIINQKATGVKCFYIAIGQKASSAGSVLSAIRSAGMESATFVIASADSPAALQYLAPYSGAAIAEYFMTKKSADTLVVYDDLSKHAAAYREMSLLLRRPPGREAYPGDVFYLHSRLLERSANLAEGGSMTALPIIETQAGDVSAYIPTNVISITDGQIFLSSDLFNSGIRPAIDVGLSVSRVGSAAQIPVMKKVASSLKLELAQLAELESFAQFSSDLDKETKSRLEFGRKVREVLKQDQSVPIPVGTQVILIWGVLSGRLSNLSLESTRQWVNQIVEVSTGAETSTTNPELKSIAQAICPLDLASGDPASAKQWKDVLEKKLEDLIPVYESDDDFQDY